MMQSLTLLPGTALAALEKTRTLLRRSWPLIISTGLACSALSFVAPPRHHAMIVGLAQIPIYFFLLAQTCRFVRADYAMTPGAVAGVLGWGLLAGLCGALAAAPVIIWAHAWHAKAIMGVVRQLVIVFADARLFFIFLLAALSVDENPIVLSWRLSGGSSMLPLISFSLAELLVTIGILKLSGTLPMPLWILCEFVLFSLLTAYRLSFTALWLPIAREDLAARDLRDAQFLREFLRARVD